MKKLHITPKAWLSGLASIAVIAGGVGWYLLSQPRGASDTSTAPEYFQGYEQAGGIPNKSDISTSEPGLLAAWNDGRVVDGNLSCTLYWANDHRVVATYYESSGFNPENKVSSGTEYKDSSVPRSTIDRIVRTYCKKS